MVSWTRINGSRAIRAVGIEGGGSGGEGDGGGGGGGGTGPVRLHVQFRHHKSKTYIYNVGNRSFFDNFISASSKGRYYVQVIKQRFDYVAKY